MRNNTYITNKKKKKKGGRNPLASRATRLNLRLEELLHRSDG
jgi:hypothetical protein